VPVARVLLLLDQMPQDPASGAARTARTICEYLAESGRFEVRALATTASEKGVSLDPVDCLPALASALCAPIRAGDRPLWRFEQRGVDYCLLDSEVASNAAWEPHHGQQFDRLFDETIAEFEPQIIFTHGGHRSMVQRWRRARALGTRIVFGLWNHGYLRSRRFFNEVDAVLTPSEFLTDKYRAALGIDSTPLPTPIEPSEVVAPERDPIFLTFVNPSIQKGVMFMARFAEELARQRPDIPLLIIESRGTAGGLVAAGFKGGFDLRRHESLMVSPGTAQPHEFFAVTRVLLAPSVWEEPSGRVASESLVNGVPPIVSDRGGLPEECGGAGVVLPLPQSLTLQTREPVAAEAVLPWLEAATRFVDDQAAYAEACSRAALAGDRYLPSTLRASYTTFFETLLPVT